MQRIVVVATRQIGDVLLTTPLIRAARERWPDAQIDVLGLAGTLGLLRGNPDVAALIETRRGGGWRDALALARRLWRRYDLALVAQESDRAHFYAFLAAPLRAGIVPSTARHAWWKRLLLRHAVVAAGDRGSTHSADEKLALLEPWRAPAAAAAARPGATVIAPRGSPIPADLASCLQPHAVVVHAPSMWRYKQWPIERYRELVVALLASGQQVVLTGSSSADDRAKIDALLDLAGPPRLVDAGGRLDWTQLTTLLSDAALYIGPDTSVTHLAAALGIPVVALFGPSNPMRWGPLGSAGPGYLKYASGRQRRGNVVVLQGPHACVPCGRAGCEDHRDSRSDCLEAIAAQRVVEEARLVLAGR
jgi:heptosyltransferase-3